MSKLDDVLSIVVNKLHIMLGTVAQAAIFVYHFKTGHDIGSGIQNTVYAYYGFLGAHALTYQKYPDAATAATAEQGIPKGSGV